MPNVLNLNDRSRASPPRARVHLPPGLEIKGSREEVRAATSEPAEKFGLALDMSLWREVRAAPEQRGYQHKIAGRALVSMMTTTR